MLINIIVFIFYNWFTQSRETNLIAGHVVTKGQWTMEFSVLCLLKKNKKPETLKFSMEEKKVTPSPIIT